MAPYFVTLGRGVRGPARLHGFFLLGDRALYFLCYSSSKGGGGDYEALKTFGPVGAALHAFATEGTEPHIEEEALAKLVAETPGSLAFTPEGLELVKQSIWGSKLVFGGKKFVVWNPGFPRPLRPVLRTWCDRHGVKAKGIR